MSHDVTGGIKTKLQCAADIVKECGVDVFIVQAGSVHAAKVLSGEMLDVDADGESKWVGTRVSSAAVNNIRPRGK
jgi:glutamate 5-kinase